MTLVTDSLQAELTTLFTKRLGVEVPSPDTDLLATGRLDSAGFVELLVQLEKRFGSASSWTTWKSSTSVPSRRSPPSSPTDGPPGKPKPGLFLPRLAAFWFTHRHRLVRRTCCRSATIPASCKHVAHLQRVAQPAAWPEPCEEARV